MTRRILPLGADAALNAATLNLGEVAAATASARMRFGDGTTAGGKTLAHLDEVQAISRTIAVGRRAYSTYASAVADAATPAFYPAITEGTVAEVPVSDTGTHTDPVVGGTVNNTGIFRWSTSPAGYQRLYDVDAAAAGTFAVQAAASATNAAASAASASTVVSSVSTNLSGVQDHIGGSAAYTQPVTVGNPIVAGSSPNGQIWIDATPLVAGMLGDQEVYVSAVGNGSLPMVLFSVNTAGQLHQEQIISLTVGATGAHTFVAGTDFPAGIHVGAGWFRGYDLSGGAASIALPIIRTVL